MAKKGLGKGLGAIFGEDVVEAPVSEKVKEVVSRETSPGDQYQSGNEYMMKLSRIEPNQGQPRKDFNQELLSELADSIKKYGVLQPLLVQKNGENYEIIAGERRWRAAKEAGLKEVPVVIKEYTKQQAMEIALIENVQREDLNPIEEAQAYQQLLQEFDLTQEEIAERVSKSRTAITNTMRLLKLDKRVQEMLTQGQLSSGHARALLSLENKDSQYQIALKIIDQKLSVREVERLVKLLGKPNKEEKPKEEERDISFIFKDLEERMKQVMGTKVIINKKDRNKGRIEIEYYSEAELERIVELIESIK
ncbi:MAG: ParB/RepB/Spo0J family partition protein [Hungatella sp.]|nr:ParB/RepB/Spo0J family partition protein [Hungatella sp.]